MSALDSLFRPGFKTAKCKTLLKLTIPRIKLLRNRREIQLKQMRRDIAKLLETGQEATARIRVEHIIREEKMMAAQEIIELFCELITVRLPIIEAQRECPLDLKEAISSVCFATPRCADLTELPQVQMLFAAKYGKEFVSAATELMPECGVNRQLVELLSVRAPDPDVKLKLLKEIAEEYELDWDPAASETELLKPHEDLLNGPMQFVSGSKLRLPEEKHDEALYSTSEQSPNEPSDSDTGFDASDFPEVPKTSLRPSGGTVSAPEMLPFPASALSEIDNESPKLHLEPEEKCDPPHVSVDQFVPFISPPSLSSSSFSVTQNDPPPSILRAKTETNVDMQDVLAAAQSAAESAERAAAAARAAASLAQLRISELVKKKNDEASNGSSDNPFHVDDCQPDIQDNPHLDRQNLVGDSDGDWNSRGTHQDNGDHLRPRSPNLPSYDDSKVELDDPPHSSNHVHQPQRLTSMDDETYFSYPNLFKSKDMDSISRSHSFGDNSHSTDKR